MSDKHRHLLGLAIKYLIKVNRSLQDKKGGSLYHEVATSA